MSGLGANFDCDLKKIIALSTLSQLGVIIIVVSLGMHELAYLHLFTHAVFKSLLFLCSGFFIHTVFDNQDGRHMGPVSNSSPIISLFFISSCMSLCGLPFMSGFYSKDLILELIYMRYINIIPFLVLFFSTILTLTYSLRLCHFLRFSGPHYRSSSIQDIPHMFIPMGSLFLIGVTCGSLLSWLFFPCFFIYLSLRFKVLTLSSLLIIFILFNHFFKIFIPSYSISSGKAFLRTM